jgi:hypothetical protein
MTFSTIYSTGYGGQFGSEFTPFWKDVESVLWAGLADDNTGYGKVAYSNDSGATWTVKDFAGDLEISDYQAYETILPVVSGNTLMVIYNSTTADVKVKRFTITRGAGGTATALTDASMTTTIPGQNTGNGYLFWAEPSNINNNTITPSSLILCWTSTLGTSTVWFARITAGGTAYTDLAGTTSSVTAITTASEPYGVVIGLHPTTKDLYACVEEASNSYAVIQYRFTASGSNWTNVPTSIQLPNSADSTYLSMVKDTQRNRLMIGYYRSSTGLFSWSWWDGSNTITSGSFSAPANANQLLMMAFASTANVTLNCSGTVAPSGPALGFETYSISNSSGDIILLFPYNTPLHLFQYNFNGTSWSGATDLGAVSSTGPNHLTDITQYLPEQYNSTPTGVIQETITSVTGTTMQETITSVSTST